MSTLNNLTVKAKDFKSIGEDIQGFDEILPINIIIGKNNSGKSSLLEVIQYAANFTETIRELGHKNRDPVIFLSKMVTEDEINRVFPSSTSGHPVPASFPSHLAYGLQWIGKEMTVRLHTDGHREYVSIEKPENGSELITEYGNQLAGKLDLPIIGKSFRRLYAERDIIQEGDGSISLGENGLGATNIIQSFYNNSNLDRSLIEDNLLSGLNEIFNPDLNFQRIFVRRHPYNNLWEIFLEEEKKGAIPLSRSGSGIKTVILVLINLILMPRLEGKNIGDYIFAFEELENNLHPGLQRRLLSYIEKVALENGCHFFITTHSNVVIDLFNRDENAQILHVTHDGEKSNVKKIVTYIDNKGVLDDLDVRASDLLQANGIVWLEGPSDRLYFNRWIDLWSNGQLKEGTHYQCVFYGGRLLSHLNALQEEAEEEHGVNLLRVNSNAIAVIDSDLASSEGSINKSKQKLRKELEAVGGYVWITQGREIENYLSADAIKTIAGLEEAEQVGQFEEFDEYLDALKSGEGKKFLKGKVQFAEKASLSFTKENEEKVLDLSTQMDSIINLIKDWNSL